MNLWIRLPEPLDAGELLLRAHRENVTYLPGRYFTVSRPDPGGLRLSFAGLTPAKIRRGVSILGEIFSTELERTQASRNLEPAQAMV
jgi:2-aminoadipate transaminase